MRPESISRVCFDASCLIGIVQGEVAFAPLKSTLAGVVDGRIEIVASTALLAELLPNHPRGNPSAAVELRQLLKTQATLIDVTPTVAELAGEFREEFGLSTWDAVHLATSVVGNADVLFVRDGKFPTEALVRGVWVSGPYDIEGTHLFNLDK